MSAAVEIVLLIFHLVQYLKRSIIHHAVSGETPTSSLALGQNSPARNTAMIGGWRKLEISCMYTNSSVP